MADCGLPRYATCVIDTPVRNLNISPARCGVVPAPAEPKLSWPGRARAIVDDHWLSPGLVHFLCDGAREHIRHAGGREGGDDADGF
jgi:hypothetical protein